MSNAGKPATVVTVTVIDPKVLEAIADVRADTRAILEAIERHPDKPAEVAARYFPAGYFA